LNTNLKKLATTGAAAIAVAAPAVLLAGAGTAQAATPPTVGWTDNGLGTVAHIADPSNQNGIETCFYSSNVAGNPLLFPFFSAVQVSGTTPADLPILGIRTGTTYDVVVTCPAGGQTKTTRSF
jgi:hypothetical protein